MNIVTRIYKANLIAAFGSFKFLPIPMVFSHNNFNPKLILYKDHIEYRGGFITREVKYINIEKIEVYFKKHTNNIVISKSTGLATFIGNFKTRDQLRDFLLYFETKGCALTKNAKMEINNLS